MSEATVEKELQTTALALVEKANVARVTNQDDLDVANDYVVRFSGVMKRWKEYWGESIEMAKASYDNLRERRDAVLKPLEAAKEKVRGIISVYLTEQRILKEAAEKRAFEEEQARIRKEAEAKENLELAEMAEEQGDKATAEEFLQKAAEAEAGAKPATSVYVPKTPELQDQHVRVQYDFVVENVADLPRDFMMANEKAIRAHVDARKANFTEKSLTLGAVIPGVKVIKRIIPVMNRRLS